MQNRSSMWTAVWVACAAPLTALASDPAGGDAHGGGHAAAPPLLSFDPGAAMWSIIVFVGLLLVLRAFAWKPILSGLQQRERFIQESLDSARREREEAEKLLKQHQRQIDQARVEASAIVDEGRRDAEAVRRRMHDEAKKEYDEMIARARREVGLARDAAVKELYDRTIALATDVAGKMIGRQLAADDHRALLDESVKELESVGR